MIVRLKVGVGVCVMSWLVGVLFEMFGVWWGGGGYIIVFMYMYVVWLQ